MNELKPFGGPGDPVAGDFSGELLVRTYRANLPTDLEAEKAWEEASKSLKGATQGKDFLPWFIANYGEEKGKSLYEYGVVGQTISASWECRDCIALDEDEYFEKINQTWGEKRIRDLEGFDELVKEKGLTEEEKPLLRDRNRLPGQIEAKAFRSFTEEFGKDPAISASHVEDFLVLAALEIIDLFLNT